MTTLEPATITIRAALMSDLDAVVALDELDTGVPKPGYWKDVFARFLAGSRPDRFVLVAEDEERLVGFVVGEVRAWEFGSPPCGWVFAIHVSPECRERGVGTHLLDSICQRFRDLGVDVVRTMISRRDELNLSFFRSQGMMAGSYIQLEKKIG